MFVLIRLGVRNYITSGVVIHKPVCCSGVSYIVLEMRWYFDFPPLFGWFKKVRWRFELVMCNTLEWTFLSVFFQE